MNKIKYQGIVTDRLGSLKTRKTRWHNTFFVAHLFAEKLCKKYFSEERGEISIKFK